MNAKKMMIACVAIFALASTASAQSESVELSEEEMAKAILNDTTKVMFRTLKEAEFTISTGDVVVGVDKDGKQVIAHEGDTIYTYAYRYFWKNDSLRVAAKSDVHRLETTETVRDEALWNKLRKVAVETQFAEAMAASSGRERDTKWDEITDGIDTLKVVLHGNDKNHWYVAVRGNYQISDGANGFGGGASVQYWSDSFWFGEIGVDATRNVMYEKAKNAGENYWSADGRVAAGIKHDFGRLRNFTVAGYGGAIVTWQQTNTRQFVDEFGNTYEMESTHSTYSPLVGATVKYRLPHTRIAFQVGVEWSQKNLTNQNASDYERHSSWNCFFTAAFGLHGNYVRTK